MNSVDLKNEIMDHLLVDDETAQQIIQLKKQRESLEKHFETYPEDRDSDRFNEKLILADLLLDHKRPYRIAIIGTTGAGKSSVANALLNRDLLLTKASRVTTGTVLEIRQTASNDNEIAKPAYRNEQDIWEFLETNFINPFQVNIEPRLIDKNLKEAIESAENSSGNEPEKFNENKVKCAGMVDQFIRQPNVSENSEFNLNEESERSLLNELIDENSDTNRSPETRQVGLIKSVFYSISLNADLDIPKTACLIDLPGLGATPLHDEIIRKNVDDANAVVFVFNSPDRIDQATDEDLIRRITESGSIKPEQMFLVFNQWDQVVYTSTGDNIESEVTEAAEDIAEKLGLNPKDKSWFFPVSATIARLAQKQLANPEKDLPDNYKIFAKYSGNIDPGNSKGVLEKTGIPKLAEALSTLAKNNVSTRIEDATVALNAILNTLEKKHRASEELPNLEKKLSDETGRSNDAALTRMQKEMLKPINNFKKHQVNKQSDLRGILELKFDEICISVNEELQKACPGLWEPIDTDTDQIHGFSYSSLAKRRFITKANIKVWHLLSAKLVGLAEKTADCHREEFSNEQVLTTLIEKGAGLQATQKAFSEDSIHKHIDDLEMNLSQATKRSAVAILGDPDHFFLEAELQGQEETEPQGQESGPNDESNQRDSMDSLRSKLGKLVGTLWDEAEAGKSDSPPAEEFKEIVECIAEIYAPLVKDNIIDGLLNIYLYERVRIDEILEEKVDQLIRGLRQEPPLEPLGDESDDVKKLKDQMEAERLRKEKHEALQEIKIST